MERAFTLAVIGEALGEAFADTHAEHQKALAAERAQHAKDLLAVRQSLNDLVVAVSKLMGAKQHKAVLDLAALPVLGDMN